MSENENLSIYNSEGSNHRQAQLRLLEMLVEFDNICKKNNIDYFLSGGTCLGAIRHGGFIPWDDDIDVDVWHTDYKKLNCLLKRQLPNWINVQDSKTDKGYYHMYMRIVDSKSKILYDDNFVREKMSYKGLFIDILPLSYSVSYWFRGIISKKLRIVYSMYRVGAKNKLKKYSLYLISPVYFLLWFIYSLLSKIYFGDKVSHSVPSIHNPKLKYSNCYPVSRIKFEGYLFNGPAKPHEYLVDLYGDDYMNIPEKKYRVIHASKIVIDD